MATVETQVNNRAALATVDMTELDLRDQTIHIKKTIDSLFLNLSRNLSEIYHDELYVAWGYKTFELYTINELDYSYRKAKYLVEIWDKFKNMDVDISRIESLGWTKAAEISRVINDDNADLWLEKAEQMAVRDLNLEVRQVIDSSIPDNRPKVTYMKFRLDSIDAAVINEAIVESQKINNTEDVALAMAQICDEWLLSKGSMPVSLSLKERVDLLNKIYNANLIINDQQSIDNLSLNEEKVAVPEEIKETKEEIVAEDEDDLLLSDEDINALIAE